MQQAAAVLLLILFPVICGGFATVIAGTDAVSTKLWADGRQIAVVTEHGVECIKPRRGGNMAYLTGHRIGWQGGALRKVGYRMTVCQHHRGMTDRRTIAERQRPVIALA